MIINGDSTKIIRLDRYLSIGGASCSDFEHAQCLLYDLRADTITREHSDLEPVVGIYVFSITDDAENEFERTVSFATWRR